MRASNWGTKGSSRTASRPLSPSASARCSDTRRRRMRSLSSPVAARVKVTTRMSRTDKPASSSRRTYRPQIVQVLPVPAEASTMRTPASGTSNNSSGAGMDVLPDGTQQRLEDLAREPQEFLVQHAIDGLAEGEAVVVVVALGVGVVRADAPLLLGRGQIAPFLHVAESRLGKEMQRPAQSLGIQADEPAEPLAR